MTKIYCSYARRTTYRDGCAKVGGKKYFQTVDGPGPFRKQVLRHQECRVVNFWRPPALPGQGKRTKLQRVLYTNWWKQHTTTVLLRTLLARMFSVLKKGTRNAHLTVHSSACGILSCLWSWLCLHWFVFLEKETLDCTVRHWQNYYLTSMPAMKSITRAGLQSISEPRGTFVVHKTERKFSGLPWSCPRTE